MSEHGECWCCDVEADLELFPVPDDLDGMKSADRLLCAYCRHLQSRHLLSHDLGNMKTIVRLLWVLEDRLKKGDE